MDRGRPLSRVRCAIFLEGEEEDRRGGKKGRLLGVITLSDVLRYVIGETAVAGDSIAPGVSETVEEVAEPPTKPPSPSDIKC